MSEERDFQTRVYKFRCLADFPEPAMKELRRAHDLSNLMIEKEKAHADRIAAAWRQHPDLEKLEQAIEDATQSIEDVVAEQRRYKQKNRSSKPSPELKAKLVEARKTRRACKAEFKEAKDRAYPILKPELAQLKDELRAELKALYRPAVDGGLYWANFNSVRDRHTAAVNAVKSARRNGQPADLRFRRWTGEGTLVVQLQRQSGQPPRDPTMIADTEKGLWRSVVQLTPAHDPDEWATLTRAQQRRVRLGTLRFRIGSAPPKEGLEAELQRRLLAFDDDCSEDQVRQVQDEVEADLDQRAWIELPVLVHRPIPLDADIAMMEITRRRLGSRYLVHVSVVVRIPNVPARVEGPAVALHVGWRALEDRAIRVGVITGIANPPEELVGVVRPHGDWSELVIPARWRDQMEYVQSVASIRGKNLEVLKKEVLEWLAAHPDHVIAGIETIEKWRSPNRFAALSLRIRGDETIDVEIRRILEAWRKQDRHLWDLEANLRDKILARRNNAFANVAAWALEEAAVLRMDTFKLTGLSRRPDINEEDDEGHRKARANRVFAAPGILRGIMADAATRRGVHLQAIDGKIASTHHACGQQLDLSEREAAVMVWCAHCQTLVDQDYNTLEMLRLHA